MSVSETVPARNEAGAMETVCRKEVIGVPEARDASLRLPRDDEGPVFSAPWEARVFAIVVQLHRDARYSWPEWVKFLSDETAGVAAGSEGANSKDYYVQWLTACERLLRHKGLINVQALNDRMSEIGQRLAGDHGSHDHRHE